MTTTDDPRHEAKAAAWFSTIEGRATRPLDGSGGRNLCDFEVLDGDLEIGVLEVTRFTDRSYRELLVAMHRVLGDGWQLDLTGLEREWMAFLADSRARVKSLREPLHNLLRRVEACGHEHVRIEQWQIDMWTKRQPLTQDQALLVNASSAGIESAHAFRNDSPGTVWVSPPGDAYMVSGTHVTEAVGAEAEKPDNRCKLWKSEGERHLWVWIEHHTPAHAMEAGKLPSEPPELQPELDRVWAAHHAGHVWSARRGEPWKLETWMGSPDVAQQDAAG